MLLLVRQWREGSTGAHLICVLEVQRQGDRTVLTIVAPSHRHVLLGLAGDLSAERANIRDEGPFVVADDLDIKVARI